MKRYVAALLLATATATAQAQVAGLVLTAAQYLILDRVPVYYIKVEATAPDFEQARQQAFRLAVEQAVGTVVLNETEMRNNRIGREDIINYSSGVVDRYNIVERVDQGRSVRVVMEVWVAHNAIANRLLNNSATSGQINGDRVAVQIGSLVQQRQGADQVLNTVMQDYPARAFDLRLQPVKVDFDSNRQAHLLVPFRISWNKKFIQAMQDTLHAINQYPRCNPGLNSCASAPASIVLDINLVADNPGAWFNDDQAWHIMRRHMVHSEPMYRLTLQTNTGQNRVYCFTAAELDQSEYRSRYLNEIGSRRIQIQGKETLNVVLKVGIDQIEQVTSAEVNVVRRSQCR